MADPLRFLADELVDLRQRDLLRGVPPTVGLNLCSNDYLGFARLPLEPGAVPGGSGASALVTGYAEEHGTAERALASWLGAEAALLFSSGYAANVGVISALVGAGDVILSDRLNHASVIDGCRLSRASVVVFDHCDAAGVRGLLAELRGRFRRCLIVTESYFGMDADVPDLLALRSAASEHDAMLMVDEAHALGATGPSGRGQCARLGVVPDVLVGTLGKAIGLHGAFVVGSAELRSFLWNRARSFVFSTAISPAIAGAVAHRVAMLEAGDDARAKLERAALALRSALTQAGARVSGEGAVVPWVLGEAKVALRAQSLLAEHGVLAVAIRPPTVPEGAARLRLTAGAWLTDRDIELAVDALRATASQLAL